MTSPPPAEIGPAPDNAVSSARNRLLACARSGIFRHAVTTKYGGLGDSFSDLTKAHAVLGRQSRDPGLILAINAHVWGSIFAILRFGTGPQKSRWLPSLINGDVISGHAITEPDTGSDTGAMTTRFQEKQDTFLLNGHKRYITNTPIAQMMVVYAKKEDSDRISAFIVKSSDPGVKFLDTPTVTGCATATMGDVILSDCAIPGTRLLGKAGAGNTMIQLSLELERAFIFSGIIGVMEWQLQRTVRQAKNRVSGKATLAQHQAISHRIADMKLRLETSRLWIAHCASQIDAGKRITSESAQAKLYISEAFLQSSLDAVQISGASGLNDELTLLVNDAMAGRLMSGSSEIQKNIIAAMLGLAGNASV